ncbi:MAG: ATP-binding protein [bacterium]|nr:ATP-binding protein [bacterium]
MYIKRKIEYDILKYLHRPEIIALIGPRQCGKTTVLKKIYCSLSDAVFLTFEDQQVLSMFENNIKQFIAVYLADKKYVFIDEFQYAKNGGKLLKYIYDLHHTKIIISGSSAIDLTVKAIKFLVGRIFVLNMLTLDFYEYLSFKNPNDARFYKKNKIDLKFGQKFNPITKQIKTLNDHFEEYAIWGGYPQVVLSKDSTEKIEILKNIYNTYFLREVKDILGLIDDYKLSRLIKSLALQIGNMVEYGELSRVSELSFTTLKKQLNFLSKTYISELIRPFYKNKRKEIVKNRKVYFYDTGLRNFIINDFRSLSVRPDNGFLLENACWMQLLKNGFEVQYWRDKNKNEVDFIINLGEGKIAAMEIKYQRAKCRKLPLAFTDNHPEAMAYCFYMVGDKIKKNVDESFLPLPLI